MPAFKRGKRDDQSERLVPDNRREDFVIVDALDLTEPLGYKPGSFAAIRLLIKDSAAFDDLPSFRTVHKGVNLALTERLKLLAASVKPLLL